MLPTHMRGWYLGWWRSHCQAQHPWSVCPVCVPSVCLRPGCQPPPTGTGLWQKLYLGGTWFQRPSFVLWLSIKGHTIRKKKKKKKKKKISGIELRIWLINSYIYCQLFFEKYAKINNSEKTSPLITGVETTWIGTCQRTELEPYIIPYTKLNSNWIKDIKGRSKTIKSS